MNTIPPIVPASEVLTATNAECVLEVTATHVSPGLLELRYQIKNIAACAMYLCNHLYRNIKFDAATQQHLYMVERNLVNIVLEETRVIVGKAVVDAPAWVLVEAPQIPCLSRVLPGDTYTETIQVREPLTPYTVYEPGPHRGPVMTCTLYFELGYFLAPPPVEVLIDVVNTPDGPVYYTDPFPASRQTIIATGPFTKQVQVISEG